MPGHCFNGQTIRQFLTQKTVCQGKQDIPLLVEGDSIVYRDEFLSRVQLLAETIHQSGHSSWVLACSNAGLFLQGLLALVMAGKRVLLPANDKPGTLQEISEHGQALLTDGSGTGFRSFVYNLHKLESDEVCFGQDSLFFDLHESEIVFFTSGSSGHAKPVTKSLYQLEAEIEALEKLWGSKLNSSVVLSCVSHQHIYGVLFRLLWPLLMGRTIDTRQFEYPEQLVEAVKDYKKVAVIASPAQLGRLPLELDWQAVHQHITAIFSSGAPLAATDACRAYQCFGRYPLEVLGSTETGGVAWRQQDPQRKKTGQLPESWTPITGVQPKLHEGQLKVFSPWLDDPSEGFVMGDCASILDCNRFLLHGRADLIVKLEGKRVSLTEIGRRLSESHLVETTEIVVLERGRQQLGAVVVLTDQGNDYLKKQGKLALSRQLKTVLSEHFEAVTLPRKWRFPESLPVNSQGKIVRKDLMALFDVMEKQYA